MSTLAGSPRRRASSGPLLVAAAGTVLALAVGIAAGDPGAGLRLPLALAVGLAVVAVAMARPFFGLLVLSFSVFFLLVVSVTGTTRRANVFDVVLVPVAAAALLGGARREARAGSAQEQGESHDTIRLATARFSRGVLLYFGLAALSLLPMGLRLGSGPALASALSLVRVLQGALLFPLGLLWLRDERRIRAALTAVFTAGVLFAVVNGTFVLGFGIKRAGIVWTVFDWLEPVNGPNEAAVGLLVLWALLQARQAARPGRVQLLLMGLVLVMLPLTQSRSGLLAFATFTLLTVRHLRWRWIAGVLVVLLLLLPLVPAEYWERLRRSLTFKQGSFEVFSFLVRLYGFQAAWQVFLANPVFGVGYLGYRFVSSQYNDLRLVLGTAENFLLETLAGLGVIGLGVVIAALRRFFQLGTAVRAVAPSGTLGQELARRHAPLLTAILVANMTGNTFVGLVGVGQMALWCALLVRSGHLAVPRGAEA